MADQEQEASLRLAIDATRAKDGSLQFTIAADQVKKAALGASDATDKVNTSGDKLGSTLMMLTKRVGAYVAAYVGIKESVRAAVEQEDAEVALAAAINLSGAARTKAMDNLKQFATEMQRLSIYSDEQVLSEMAYAKNLGVTTNELKQATVAAAGLAAKYRMDLSTAMMLIGRAHEGQTGMMSRYGIVLDDTMTAQEKYNAIIRIGLDNFRLMTEQTRSASGSWKQIKNELGEIAEAIGAIALPAISGSKPAIVSWLEDLKVVLDYDVNRIKEMPTTLAIMKQNVANIGEAFAGWWTGDIKSTGGLPSILSGAIVDAKTYENELKAAQKLQQDAIANNTRLKAIKLAKDTIVPGAPIEAPKPPTFEEQKQQADSILKLYQDMYNGLKTAGEGFTSFSKSNDAAYLEAFKTHLSLQRREYEKTIKDKVLLDQWEASQLEQFSKRNEEDERQFASQRAEMVAKMYEQMQNYDEGYYAAQKSLLDIQYQDYSKFIKDKSLLDKWYSNQLQKVRQDTSFEWQQLKGVVNDTKGALSDFFMTFSDGENILQTFGRSMQRMFANMAAEALMYQAMMTLGMNPGGMGVQNPMMGSFMGGILGGIGSWLGFGGGAAAATPGLESFYGGGGMGGGGFTDLAPISFTLHSGGIVGISSAFGKRTFSFEPAVRLHEGTNRLAPDEYRAILQSGERVQSRAEVARGSSKTTTTFKPNINVRIINVKNEDEIPDAMAGAKGEKVIINHLRRNGII